MKYWEEYQSKYGFGDGDATPPDAYALRTVYVREINKLAAERGSVVRLLAWDRNGCHNTWLIIRVQAALCRDVPAKRLCVGQIEGGWQPKNLDTWVEPDADEIMLQCIADAHDMELDSYVTTTVRTRRQK